MKTAHVTLYPPKGKKHISSSGVASYSKNLIAHMPGQHAVVCEISEGPKRYDEDNVEVHRVFRRQPNFVWKAHGELKKIGADTVHIQQELALFGNVVTAYLLQWLVFLWRQRTVITLHGVVDPRAIDTQFVRENNSKLPVWMVKLAFRILYTPLMKWSRKIIVHEQYFKDIVVHSYGIDERKVEVVHHGVEALEKDDKLAARRQLDLPAGGDIALFMGYATGYKGLDLLLEGFSDYARKNPEAYLVIGAGKHPKLHSDEAYLAEYDRLQQKAARLIPKDQYVWRGFIPEKDITAYYSACDVSLYPYTTAMSSSGPMSFAIGTQTPFLVSTAFADIFATYPHLLFERTPRDLAAKLDHFFTHRAQYDEASGELKRQRTWATIGQKTAQIYEEVIL